MKRGISIFLVVMLLVLLPFPAFATNAESDVIVDKANLLTSEEEDKLADFARQIYDNEGIFTAILTVESLGIKTAEAYTDDYYDTYYYYDYPDGILLLIALDTREWHISTCGRAIELLTDYELDQVFFTMADELGDDRFYDAFSVYLETLPLYLAVAPESEPGFGDFIRILLIALLIGAAAGGITILVMRSQMNTAKPQHSAGNYLVNGSFQVKKHLDFYLYSRVTRTAIPKNNSSSTHRSSGGISHGGRGGRF